MPKTTKLPKLTAMSAGFSLKRIASLLLAAILAAQAQAAQKWWVHELANDPEAETQVVTTNRFEIYRSPAFSNSVDVVNYRTVSLSALAEEQFVPVSGQLVFAPGEISKTVSVVEKWSDDSAFWFRLGTKCSYIFEVLDINGFVESSAVREMTKTIKVATEGLFDERCVNLLDWYHYDWDGILVQDDGFDQFDEISDQWEKSLNVSGDRFGLESLPRAYLSSIDAQLCMSVELGARELYDGFQHIQIIVNKDRDVYDDDALGSDPGTPHHSSYLACFSHSDPHLLITPEYYSFPVTTAGNNEGAKKPWKDTLSNTQGDLMKQRFNTGCRAQDGRLALPFDLDVIRFRFDASGDDEDDWVVVKYLDVYVQVADFQAPMAHSIVLCPGPHVCGNTVRISIEFSELVVIRSDVTLSTSWGDFAYESGSGGNVLTFRGVIDAEPGTRLQVTKLNGNVTDLAENPVLGPVRKTFGVTAASPLSGYSLWSASHGIGTWNAKDALGIHNVFRYTFDKPAGAFETPALIDIAIEGGSVVVKTPPVVNAEGFAVSVVESSDAAGETVTASKPVNETGRTVFTMEDAASRFYRLSARQDLQ